MMNTFLEKVLAPEVWLIAIIVNCLLAAANVLSTNFTFALLNVFSGAICYLGYLRAKKRVVAKNSDD